MDIYRLWRALTSGQLLLTWISLTLITGVRTLHLCTQCDCKVSDPDNGEKGVINVKPKCRQGHVTWLSSYGAIRLELDPGHAGEYRICVRVESDNIKTIVSEEVVSKTHGNYKLKIVNNVEVRLSPLFTASEQGKTHCVTVSKPLHLYLETERGLSDQGVPKVKVHHDIEKASSRLFYSPLEECRPCTDRELLRAYCSSDFVAVGKMDDVVHNGEDGLSSIKVSLTKLVSQRDAVFRKPPEGWRKPHELMGVVHAPLACGIRRGTGEFLFTGHVRLGQAMLHCAPRYEQELKDLLKTATINNELQCSHGS